MKEKERRIITLIYEIRDSDKGFSEEFLFDLKELLRDE